MGKDNNTDDVDNFDGFFSRARQEMAEQLPKEITDVYDVLSSISETKLHSSYLLEDRKQHFRVLLKLGHGESVALLRTEAELGEKVRTALSETDGRVISYKEIDGKGYLLRQYIEGMNLTEYVERRSILTSDEIYDIMHILCHKISILHKLNPPVIHRDIKPENIIIRAKSGRIIDVYIIDYGTARMYDETKEHDTVFVGTRQTAAPEQYGFSQTDERTDIYGLGKVLCYMLTGDFDVDKLKESSKGLLRHMQLTIPEYNSLCRAAIKSTYLDPMKRYTSVGQFHHACCKGNRFKSLGKAFVWVLLVMLLVGVSFIAGVKWGSKGSRDETDTIVTDKEETVADETGGDGGSKDEDAAIDGKDGRSDAADNSGDRTVDGLVLAEDGTVVFESELMKEAVQKELPAETPITPEALSEVHSIRIIGTEVYDRRAEINSVGELSVNGEIQFAHPKGDVSDLSVIMHMENLEELCLCNQVIDDISVLEGLTVQSLLLMDNDIMDFSVIETMPNLETLYIGKNPAGRLPDLSKCTSLSFLNIDNMVLNDLEPLKGLNLNSLELGFVKVFDNDYEVLKEIKGLRHLGTNDPEEGFVEVVGELTELTELNVFGWPEEDFTRIENLINLKELNTNSNYVRSFKGLEKLKRLQYIYANDCAELEDLHGIEELPMLDIFWCNMRELDDLTPLLELQNIKELGVNESVAKRLMEEKPELEEVIVLAE
ncbi:MAG: protein kinase [Lachnospiraceae bacterium]|nr:protein kinase [Lachnospiraceae bacterium]